MKGCKKRKVKISAKCLFTVSAYSISISTHFTPFRADETVRVTCHNYVRFGVSPCNSAQTVKIVMRFLLNQFIDGLFTYVVSNKDYMSCNGRMINNWWIAKDMEDRVPEFAWIIIGSSTDSFLRQTWTEQPEPDHSLPPSTKANNAWNYTFTPPVRQGWPTYNRTT